MQWSSCQFACSQCTCWYISPTWWLWPLEGNFGTCQTSLKWIPSCICYPFPTRGGASFWNWGSLFLLSAYSGPKHFCCGPHFITSLVHWGIKMNVGCWWLAQCINDGSFQMPCFLVKIDLIRIPAKDRTVNCSQQFDHHGAESTHELLEFDDSVNE